MATRNILITGASSGIGAALARRYAAPGVHLELWGRDSDRLTAVAEACRARGASCDTACFDLADAGRLAASLQSADAAHPLDLAILNAGLGGSLPARRAGQDFDAAKLMIAVNFSAPVLAANLLADAMGARKSGRIVLIGSVAAAFPLPMAPVYAGTKAGLATFADALHLRLESFGVGVTLVSPGFVDTPMSQGLKEPRPFLIGVEKAAAMIVREIERGARHIVVPWQFAVIKAAAALLPRAALLAILSRIARRLPS
jgi:short-subunit dehydrogenase